MARAGKKKWVWVGAAVLGCLIVLLLLVVWWPQARPEADVVFLQAETVLKEPNTLQRLVGAFRSKLVSAPTVMISAEIVTSERLTSLNKAADLIGREALAEKDGVQVWMVEEDEMIGISEALMLRRTNLIANPRMTMEEGQVGSTLIGRSIQLGGTNIDVGVTMRMKAARAKTKTDLFLGVMGTDLTTGSNEVASAAMRTNMNIGARVQLPAGWRVLFVCDRKNGEGPVCVFVSIVWIWKQK